MPCHLNDRACGSSHPILPPKRGIPLGTEGVRVAFGRWLGCCWFGWVVSLAVCLAGSRALLKRSPTSLDWSVGLLPVLIGA